MPSKTSRDNVIIGNEATKSLTKGISKGTEAIKISYGPKGVNAIIEHQEYPYHVVANDCETILQAIHVSDPYEKIALDLLKELSTKAHKDSGDGRKTTCIIAESLLKSGLKSRKSGVQLKNEMDVLIPIIEKKIDQLKKPITVKDVEDVATIASESREIGTLLREIYEQIGIDGIIIPESSGTYSTTYQIINGIRFTGTGYLSPFMVFDEETEKLGKKPTTAVYDNPAILVTKRKINTFDEIYPILNELRLGSKRFPKGTPLVIFTDDMDSNVAAVLVQAHKDKVCKCTIVKAPVLWKGYVFEDFAKVTGSTVVEDATGVTLKNLGPDHLGTCARITIDKDEVRIIGGADITDHINILKANDDTDSKLRLSWLTTKTCILRLGANNESELSYKRLKCYDAINASRLALRDGIVEGGGLCLYTVAGKLPQTPVGNMVAMALMAPFNQNAVNMGLDLEAFGGFESSVIDAAAVVKNAVRNAIALASTVLTGRILIRLPDKSAEEIAGEVLKNKGLRF